MRLSGNSKPELTIAERTRSRASRTALSGSPTTVNAGRPARMSASTHTRRLATPSSAKVAPGRASERRLEVVERDEAPVVIDDDADRVEPQVLRPRAIARLGEEGGGHPPH